MLSCVVPEDHICVKLPAAVRRTGGGGRGVRTGTARLQVSHVGHQVEAVTTGHAAQPAENLNGRSTHTCFVQRVL